MKLRYPLAFFAFFVIFGLVGRMDYEDAVAVDLHYSEMVCAGHWPDYKDQKPECKEGVKWKTESRTF